MKRILKEKEAEEGEKEGAGAGLDGALRVEQNRKTSEVFGGWGRAVVLGTNTERVLMGPDGQYSLMVPTGAGRGLLDVWAKSSPL